MGENLLVSIANDSSEIGTYIAVAVIKTQGKPPRGRLRFDSLLLVKSPWHRYDLWIVLPWLLVQDRCKE